jgi:hypothetical protein
MGKTKQTGVVPVEQISQSILVFRGDKVLLDEELASLYGVTTSALVQAVKRNIGRFPEDFMFQLTAAEWAVLRSRIVIPTSSRGGRRFARDLPPNCFPWRADRCRRDPSVTQSKPPVRRGQQPERPDHQKLQVLEERRPLALNRMANELPDPGDHKYRD